MQLHVSCSLPLGSPHHCRSLTGRDKTWDILHTNTCILCLYTFANNADLIDCQNRFCEDISGAKNAPSLLASRLPWQLQVPWKWWTETARAFWIRYLIHRSWQLFLDHNTKVNQRFLLPVYLQCRHLYCRLCCCFVWKIEEIKTSELVWLQHSYN